MTSATQAAEAEAFWQTAALEATMELAAETREAVAQAAEADDIFLYLKQPTKQTAALAETDSR